MKFESEGVQFKKLKNSWQWGQGKMLLAISFYLALFSDYLTRK